MVLSEGPGGGPAGPAFQSSRFWGFFPLKLLIGDVSYSQRCLVMRKKELPFVHIQDF